MDWVGLGSAFGVLALGCALRLLLPYVTTGLQAISDGGWSKWPPFEAKYLASFALALIGYAVVLLTSDGALSALIGMSFTSAVMIGYTGGDLAREAIRMFVPKLR